MPVRSNFPLGIYVPPTIVGSLMWIVFGVGQEGTTSSLHQFSSINSGFLLEISAVKESGNNNIDNSNNNDSDTKDSGHTYTSG